MRRIIGYKHQTKNVLKESYGVGLATVGLGSEK